MITRELVITNKLGLHARAAARLVTLTARFESEIFLERNGNRVNGKSIMGVMMLAAAQGTRLILTAEGADEEAAVTEIVALVENRFDEAE